MDNFGLDLCPLCAPVRGRHESQIRGRNQDTKKQTTVEEDQRERGGEEMDEEGGRTGEKQQTEEGTVESHRAFANYSEQKRDHQTLPIYVTTILNKSGQQGRGKPLTCVVLALFIIMRTVAIILVQNLFCLAAPLLDSAHCFDILHHAIIASQH
mmetsp:Transcript_29533/g.57109  ORF Transcript_29533/g.57109 Transcript_29533/m.57109 type:complete len:154 (-) Transcript_29533:23-484(-)